MPKLVNQLQTWPGSTSINKDFNGYSHGNLRKGTCGYFFIDPLQISPHLWAMELALLILSSGLFILGSYRLLMFRKRIKRYEKIKATVTNINIESRFFSSDGTEITKNDYLSYSQSRAMYKEVHYYSPEITYTFNEGNTYTGTWWTEMAGTLPFNIGERIDIYSNPRNPAKFFLYDKTMMFWEPLLLLAIGLAGIIFFLTYMI